MSLPQIPEWVISIWKGVSDCGLDSTGLRVAPYINVGLLESLGLVGLPDHVALGGVGVQANPALELVIGRHSEDVFETRTLC